MRLLLLRVANGTLPQCGIGLLLCSSPPGPSRWPCNRHYNDDGVDRYIGHHGICPMPYSSRPASVRTKPRGFLVCATPLASSAQRLVCLRSTALAVASRFTSTSSFKVLFFSFLEACHVSENCIW